MLISYSLLYPCALFISLPIRNINSPGRSLIYLSVNDMPHKKLSKPAVCSFYKLHVDSRESSQIQDPTPHISRITEGAISEKKLCPISESTSQGL